MDIFLNTTARDPRHALVAALADSSEVPFPALTFGDTVTLNVYLVTSAGAYHADAGSDDLTASLTLGPANDASLISSPTFTPGGTDNKAFTAALPVTGDTLALILAAIHEPLILTFSTTEAAAKTTWLATPAEILGSIA